MKMHLHWNYYSGHFGDPALYIMDTNSQSAMLFDCGALAHFSTRQLLRVSHIFLSHCHIDHFFGFDHFLRVHMGSEKTITIMGPPETSRRVAGKLQAYTWNLVLDQNLEFIVVDLDTVHRTRKICHFHARTGFRMEREETLAFDPRAPIFEAGSHKVSTTTLDHRTPSMAYAIEENMSISVNSSELRKRGLKPGRWLHDLKTAFQAGELDLEIEAHLSGGTKKTFPASEIAPWALIPRQRHKIAYVTDGAAHEANYRALLELIMNADILFAETCFLERNRVWADETSHFTARFIGRLAEECHVKQLVPIHFSKRYLGCPDDVTAEIQEVFHGEVLSLWETDRSGYRRSSSAVVEQNHIPPQNS